MCCRTDCKTPNAPADLFPCIKLVWKDAPAQPDVMCKLPMKHCKQCADNTGLNDLLTDDGWTKIVQAIQDKGGRAPDRALSTLVFERLDVRNRRITTDDVEALTRIRKAYRPR